MRRVGLKLLVSLALAMALLPAAASAAPPSLTAIEGEVMCPICGTLLELSDSPQGQRERAFVERLIARGDSRSQIKDALVAQYGPRVLALPRASGFDLSAYLIPAISFLVAALALALGVARWRRNASRPGSKPAASAPQGEAAERLDADIARYDL